MADRDSERFYWLKLHDTFFSNPEMLLLERGDNGKEYALIYLKLMCLATKYEGYLRYTDLLPYDCEMIGTIVNSNTDIVKGAMQRMLELELIEILDDKTLYLHKVAELLGSETGSAARKRSYRNSIKGDNVPLLSQECPQEIDIELEKEIEKDTRVCAKAPPTFDEVSDYINGRGNKVDAELFYNYYVSQGWKKANGQKLKDWKAAVVTWEKKEKDYGHSRDSKAGEKPAKEFDIHYDNE